MQTPWPEIQLTELARVMRYFSWGADDPDTNFKSFEHLERALEFRVRDLLERDLARLTQVFYQIDLSEARVEHAFEEPGPNGLAGTIASLLLTREAERIRSARLFEGGDDEAQ